MKRYMCFFLSAILVLSGIAPMHIWAEDIQDYREVNFEGINKPVTSFTIINDSSGNSVDSSSLGINIIEASIGDSIYLTDTSTGKGSIVEWDWQIFGGASAIFKNQPSYTFTVDKGGIWDVYLSVQDDQEIPYNPYIEQNWSDNGSHRQVGTRNGIKMWWYFVQMQIDVKGRVDVYYEDVTTGNALSESDSYKNIEMNTDPSYSAKSFEGYKCVGYSADYDYNSLNFDTRKYNDVATVTIGEHNAWGHIKFYYEPETTGDVEIHYEDISSWSEIQDADVHTGLKLEEHTYSAPDIDGYIYKGASSSPSYDGATYSNATSGESKTVELTETHVKQYIKFYYEPSPDPTAIIGVQDSSGISSTSNGESFAIAEGETTTQVELFNDSMLRGASVSSYSWYLDGSFIGTTSSLSQTITKDLGIGNYTAKIEFTSGGTTYSDTISFSVEDAPPPPPSSDLAVTAKLNLPSDIEPNIDEVDGTFKFTATSGAYPLTAWEIIEGAEYISGATSGTLSGLTKIMTLPVEAPVGKRVEITVQVTDSSGATATDSDSDRAIEVQYPPDTRIKVPNILYPKKVTDTGDFTNVLEWTFSDPNDPEDAEAGDSDSTYDESEYTLYKQVNGSWILVETAIQEDLDIVLVGEPDELFKLDVTVFDKTGESASASETVRIDNPTPKLDISFPQRVYIRENLGIYMNEYPNIYPNKYYPFNFDKWQVVDTTTNQVVHEEAGKLPTSIFMDWSNLNHLKGSKFIDPATYLGYTGGYFQQGRTYEIKQLVSNELKTGTTGRTLYTVPILNPFFFIPSTTVQFGDVFSGTISIYQPQSSEIGGMREYTPTYDETNTSYEVVSPEGAILMEGMGIFDQIEITEGNGFSASTEEDRTYKIKQYAINDKGTEFEQTGNLIIEKLPCPVIYASIPNTYINRDVPVDVQIEDELGTTWNNSNTEWKLEELDANGNVVAEIVPKTGGIPDKIFVHDPPYKEGVTYRFTQWATNSLGITGKGSTEFSIFLPYPPNVDLAIKERDTDPLTEPNIIYKDESVKLAATATDDVFPITETYWNIQNTSGVIVNNGTGLLNGLYPVTDSAGNYLPIGEYTIHQYAKNDRDRVGEDSISIRIKEVSDPIIEIDTNLDEYNFNNNILYFGDQINIAAEVEDINKSEQHPFGFDLYKRYAIKDLQGNYILQEDSVANINMLLNSSQFTQGKEYIFGQYARNNTFSSKQSLSEIHFTIGNKKPTIDVNVVAGDEIPPIYIDEPITIKVTMTDEDGTIEDVQMYLDGEDYTSNPNLSLLSTEVTGLGTQTAVANVKYKAAREALTTFKVVTTDNFGDSSTKDINFNVVSPYIVPSLKITNEDTIQKKENRYIEYDLSESEIFSPFHTIEKERTIIEYKKDDGYWTTISSDQNYEDTNIRVYYPNYPSRDIISTYPKVKGNYTVRAKLFAQAIESDWVEKTIAVLEDQKPTTDFSVIAIGHRITEDFITTNPDASIVVKPENLGRGFFTIRDNVLSLDGDFLKTKKITISYDPKDGSTPGINTITLIQDSMGIPASEEIVINAPYSSTTIQVQDLTNYKLTFLTGVNELGDYEFAITAEESITQLPLPSNPLYNEIIGLRKTATTDHIDSQLDNLAPNITLEVINSESINLIIHFDDQPTDAEKEEVNKLVDELKGRGVRVNIVYEYDRY